MKFITKSLLATILLVVFWSNPPLANSNVDIDSSVLSKASAMAKHFGLTPSEYIILSSKIMSRLDGYDDSPLPKVYNHPTYQLLMDKFNSGLTLNDAEINEILSISANAEQQLLNSFGISGERLSLYKLNELIKYFMLYRKDFDHMSTPGMARNSSNNDDEEDETETITITAQIIDRYNAGFGDFSIYIAEQAAKLDGYQNNQYITYFTVEFSSNNTQQNWAIYSNGTVSAQGPIMTCEGGVCLPANL